MATLAATPTTFAFQTGSGTTHTIVLNATCTNGMTLVLVDMGGSTLTANLTNSGGTAFTFRSHALGAEACEILDVVCAGGETQIFITQSGSANCAGVIYQFTNLGAFIAAGNNGAGVAAGAANDQCALTGAISIGAHSNAVLVSGFDVVFTGTGNALNEFHGLGPQGQLYLNGTQQGAAVRHMYASGLSDVTSSQSFPASQSAGNFKAVSQWITGTQTLFAVGALYIDTSGTATNTAPANAIVGENTLPGTVKANWFLTGTSLNNSTIAGFTDKLSYAPGDTVSFKVDSTTATGFRVEIYRLGFYNYETNGARNVLGVGTGGDAGYITGTATAQGAPTVDGTLGSTSAAAWSVNATWAIPSSAVPGVYVFILRRTDVTTDTCGGAFVVRTANPAGKIAVCVSDFTWNAYNVWGATTDNGTIGGGTWTGRSVYQIGGDGASGNLAHRAYAVCFDRPMGTGSSNNLTWLYDTEQPFITFAEAQGYNLSYHSNWDLDNDSTATLLIRCQSVWLIGHQEYWSTAIYNSLTAAANAGVSFHIQASNVALWHVGFAVADTNHRTMICYKDSTSVDVTAGFTGTGLNPNFYSGTWRDTRTGVSPFNTDVRSENALTGQLFIASGPLAVQISIPFASKGQPIWRNSTGITGLVSGSYTVNIPGGGGGDEMDQAGGQTHQPPNLVNLGAYSGGTITTGANAVGDIYTTTLTNPSISFSLYRRYASRALIMHTGTWDAWWGITRYAKTAFASASVVTTPDINWQNAFLCAMYDLGCVPATPTCMQPATDTNVTNPSTGAPALSTDKTGVTRAYGLRCPEDGLFMATVL